MVTLIGCARDAPALFLTSPDSAISEMLRPPLIPHRRIHPEFGENQLPKQCDSSLFVLVARLKQHMMQARVC